jgi:CarD family transcriptional regulator
METNSGEAGLFDIGDKVVYPHHGAGTVVRKEKREVLGETREYLTIQILHNDMTVNVPCENAERVGLRQVIDQRTVTMVVRTLSGGSTEMPKNRNNEKGLSTGEKQMFVKAKKILASELMYAKDMNEEEAAAWLDDVLSRAGQPKPKARAKPKTPATVNV